MDTNQKTQQINTFAKGMDTDTSDMLLSNEAYRMARNLRFTSDDCENLGELTAIPGANFKFVLDEDYRVYATTVVRGCAIVIIVKNDNTRWAVLCLGEDDLSSLDGGYMPWSFISSNTNTMCKFICTKPIGNAFKNKLSLTTRFEDKSHIKLYIADAEHPLMCLNINLGAGDSTVYTDFKRISSAQSILLSQPSISAVVSGHLKAGIVQYAYVLYNSNGVQTHLSPLSKAVAINKTISGDYNDGYENQKQSQMGLQVSFAVDNDYEYIRVYRISYLENGQLPTIELIVDEEHNGSYELYDNGLPTLQEITVEEFNSLLGIIITPVAIEQKDGYLFAGNIKYYYDQISDIVLNMDFRAFSSGDAPNGSTTQTGIGTNHDANSWVQPDESINYINPNLSLQNDYYRGHWYTPIHGDIQQNVLDQIGGYGANISWKFEKLQRQENAFGSNVINVQSTTRSIGSTYLNVYNNTLSKQKSLRRDEVYRYGIVLYSKDGIAYPVKWIADIRTPDMKTLPFFNHMCYYNQFQRIENFIDLYVRFTIPESVLNTLRLYNIGGYEIVRVNRSVSDKATITQGVISALVKGNSDFKRMSVSGHDDYDINGKAYCPSGLITLNQIRYYTSVHTEPDTRGGASFSVNPFFNPYRNASQGDDYAGCTWRIGDTNLSCLQFFSPEVLYQDDDIVQLIDSSCVLQPISVLLDYYDQSVDPVKLNENSNTQYNWQWSDNPVYHNSQYPDTLNVLTQGVHGNKSGNREDSDYTNAPKYTVFSCTKPFSGHTRRYNWIDQASFNLKYLYDPYVGSGTAHDYALEDGTKDYEYSIHRLDFGLDIYDNLNTWENTYPIEECKLIESPKYSDLVDVDGNLNVKDKVITISGVDGTINLFAAPYLALVSTPITVGGIDDNDNSFTRSPAGPAGKSLILSSSKTNSLFETNDEEEDPIRCVYQELRKFGERSELFEKNLCTLLCNIRRKNITPYGGYSKSSRNNSIYHSHGQYFAIPNSGSHSFVVKDGDCFLQVFECVSMYKWYSSQIKNFARPTVIYQVPVETEIDIVDDYGDRFSKVKSVFVQEEPCNYADVYVQTKPAYQYNMAYSSEQTARSFSPNIDKRDERDSFDCRVHYSNQINDLRVDDWLIFQPLNYIDVDTKYGQITDLRTFHNTLLFWQESAVGVLSVKERVQIADESNLPLILGTGGVLDRYDYLNTVNGMQENQFAETQSDTTLYWWDYKRKEILAYSGGTQVVPLSKAKHVQSYLNAKTWLRTDPKLIFDKKYNEVLFAVSTIPDGSEDLKETLVYSEITQQFTGVYNIFPAFALPFIDSLYLISSDNAEIKVQEGNLTKTYSGKAFVKWNKSSTDVMLDLTQQEITPYLKYVVNDNPQYVKVFDTSTFAGSIYGGGNDQNVKTDTAASTLNDDISFTFKTPLKQEGVIDGTKITNRQYEFNFSIPRNNSSEWGDRLRGKTMQCELSSTNNSVDFSLQYIITKYRVSWS